jgi:hypothetical protein
MTISALLQHHGVPAAEADKLAAEHVSASPAIRAAKLIGSRFPPVRKRTAAELDLERAQQPFDGAFYYTRPFPRAGVRRRADGRFQVRIWIDPVTPDPVQGGAVESLAEAVEFGAMIAGYGRADIA